MMQAITFPWLRSFLFLVLSNMAAITSTQLIASQCRDNMINYTSNRIYNENLNSVLSSLPNKIDDNGFHNDSAGKNPNRVNVIALCRGDIQLDRCRSCVREASTQLLTSCPDQKQAVIHLEFCMLRISNATIFRVFVSDPLFFLFNTQSATDPEKFERDRGWLIENLREQAASGDFQLKVAYGSRKTSDHQRIYAILQCSPDLFADDCYSCLGELDRTQRTYCSDKIGCRALGPSCNFRYETLPFYNETRLRELQPPKRMLPPPSSV